MECADTAQMACVDVRHRQGRSFRIGYLLRTTGQLRFSDDTSQELTIRPLSATMQSTLQLSQTPHAAIQREILDNIEFGESLVALLSRKAEAHLAAVAPAHTEETVELLRSLLNIQVVQSKLGRERQRLSILKSC